MRPHRWPLLMRLRDWRYYVTLRRQLDESILLTPAQQRIDSALRADAREEERRDQEYGAYYHWGPYQR